jgi:hypothetical protein
VLLVLAPSLLLRLLAKPLLQSLSLLQQLLLLLLLLRRAALLMPAGNVAMSPVLLARARMLGSRCCGKLVHTPATAVAQGASSTLPTALGVIGAVAVDAAAAERAGARCCMQLNVLRRTGAGLWGVAVGGSGAGAAAAAGILTGLPLKDAATETALVLLSSPKLQRDDSTGDRGSNGSCCCSCQVTCRPVCVAVAGVVLLSVQGLAVLAK